MGNTAYSKLPIAWRRAENSIYSQAILKTFDDYQNRIISFWEDYKVTLVDPMTVDSTMLDRLATKYLSPWRTLWNKDWSEDVKRLLLRDQNIIFSRRLFPDTLILLFSHFGLFARLKYNSGWILGEVLPPATSLPATLGNSIFDYSIVTRHQIGTPEFELVRWISENFGSPFLPEIEIE